MTREDKIKAITLKVWTWEYWLWHLIKENPVMIWDVLDYIEKNIWHSNPCPLCWNNDIQIENFDNWLSWMQSEFSWWYCWKDDCDWSSNNRVYNDLNWDAWDVKYCSIMDLVWINENFWKEKRKPLEEQTDECIDYIYNLVIWTQ